MEIKQEYYPTIEFDNTERDIIQLWQRGKQESNIIQIERINVIDLLIKLRQCLDAKEVPGSWPNQQKPAGEVAGISKFLDGGTSR